MSTQTAQRGGRWHVVRRGDNLAKIAREGGFSDWRTVYRHPENAGLRRVRPDPASIEPGDRVFVPTPVAKRAPIKKGQKRRFQLSKPPSLELAAIVVEARKAHRDYLRARDAYVAWKSDPQNAALQYIAQWCEGLSHNKKIKEKIDEAALAAWKREHEDGAIRHHSGIEEAAERLIALLEDPALVRWCTSHGRRGHREWASLVQGLGECVAGGKWIERELENGSGVWAKLKLPASPAESPGDEEEREREEPREGDLGERLGTAEGAGESAEKVDDAKKVFEAVEPFIDALAEFAGTIQRVHEEEAVLYVARLVHVRFDVKVANLITRETLHIRGGMDATVVFQRDVTVLVRTTALERETAERLSHGVEGVLGTFAKVIALVNLAAKINVLRNEPNAKNWISASGAMAEFLGAFKSVNEPIDAFAKRTFLRLGRNVAEDGAPIEAGAAEVAAAAAAEGGEVAVGFFEIVLKGFAEKASVLAVVAGVIDTVTGSMEAYEEYEKGNFGATGAKIAVAVGGALVAAGATLCFIGAASSATVALAPLGLGLLVAGTFVSAAGAIASWIWSESDLEVWADHCSFGRRPFQNKFAAYADLRKQIEGLQDALYQVRIKGSLGQDVSVVEIEPANLTLAARVTCYVSVHGDDFGSNSCAALPEQPLARGEPGCTVEFAAASSEEEARQCLIADQVKSIKVSFQMPMAYGNYLSGRGKVNWATMMVHLSIDPDGDGANPIKRSAEIKQGILGWIESKL